MPFIKDSAIGEGSVVLIIGVNGLLAANTADQLLNYGFRVRGTVRNTDKSSWMIPFFNDKYGKDKFELVEVKDLLEEGAFAEAVKGVAAVVSAVSITNYSYDPDEVITPSINMALNALRSAYAEPTVKRFVLTSSSAAAGPTIEPGNKSHTINQASWNEADVKAAWEKPHTPAKFLKVYGASKTLQEQAVWKFHKENHHKRPDLVVNAVLSDMNFGPSLDEKNFGYPSTSGMAAAIMMGQVQEAFLAVVNQDYIDVRDTGRLHVAAVAFPDVENERIFGCAGPYSWDDILDIVRRVYPHKTWPNDIARGHAWVNFESRERGEKLLQRLGQPGWVPFEECILANVPSPLK